MPFYNEELSTLPKVFLYTLPSSIHLLSLKSGQTVTLSIDMIAEGPIVAVTTLLTFKTVSTRRARISTNLTLF